jgi:hypothetical protein
MLMIVALALIVHRHPTESTRNFWDGFKSAKARK